MKELKTPPKGDNGILFGRLHIGIFWNNHFTTFTIRLEVGLLDYFFG